MTTTEPQMKPKNRKTPLKAPYPRISVRLRDGKRERMEKVRDKSGLSFGQIVDQGLDDKLPQLEQFYNV